MPPSSALCLIQEAIQRKRAAAATLENVRTVAEKAADAWQLEAKSALRRENRKERLRLEAETRAEKRDELLREGERVFSENPDRGFAGACTR